MLSDQHSPPPSKNYIYIHLFCLSKESDAHSHGTSERETKQRVGLVGLFVEELTLVYAAAPKKNMKVVARGFGSLPSYGIAWIDAYKAVLLGGSLYPGLTIRSGPRLND